MKPKHRLSDIDLTAMEATCSVCGPNVRIRWSGRKANGNYGVACRGARNALRSPWRLHKGPLCERCGFEPEDPCQLDVHHLDGDRSNNHVENLETLCANCHRLVTKREGHHRQPSRRSKRVGD